MVPRDPGQQPMALRCLKAALNADCDGQAGLQELAGNATLLFYLTRGGQGRQERVPRKAQARFPQVPAPALTMAERTSASGEAPVPSTLPPEQRTGNASRHGRAALSIFAAARDCGTRVALRTGGRAYTFDALAARTRERIATLARDPCDPRPVPVVGVNSLDTVITLYALLERRVPALLLHSRLTAAERDALLRDAAAAGALPVDDAAAVLHTSGTTGRPRAAVLTRAALEASARASEANLGWYDDDCWMLCMPLAHVGGLSILTRCLVARRALALEPGFDLAGFPQALNDRYVTIVSLVPTMLTRILDSHPMWQAPATLRAILLGGAPAPRRLLLRARERRLPVLVTYGLTETCSQVTTTPYALRHTAGDHGVGTALPGIEVRVRGGQIEVRGPVLMAGYWTEPLLSPGAWLPTGDLGAIDAQGFLHVHARRHDLIVTGGENVYPVEVENALESCPGVRAAAVFGLPDPTWGQAVAALLVGDPALAGATTLLDHLAGRLAPHKRPRHVGFVDRLPQNRAGKLDRAALAQFADLVRPLAWLPRSEP